MTNGTQPHQPDNDGAEPTSRETGPLLVTMRELSEDTAGVLARVNEQNRPAVVTRHGRLVALVQPLFGRNVEGAAIAALLAEQEAAGCEPADAAGS